MVAIPDAAYLRSDMILARLRLINIRNMHGISNELFLDLSEKIDRYAVYIKWLNNYLKSIGYGSNCPKFLEHQ